MRQRLQGRAAGCDGDGTGLTEFAKVALLRTYHKKARLLAAVDRIARQIQHRVHTQGSKGSEQT